MVFPWFSHGFPMVFPWFSHGFPYKRPSTGYLLGFLGSPSPVITERPPQVNDMIFSIDTATQEANDAYQVGHGRHAATMRRPCRRPCHHVDMGTVDFNITMWGPPKNVMWTLVELFAPVTSWLFAYHKP